MKTILVAINGQETTDNTVRRAADIARAEGGELVILYACSQKLPHKRQLEFATKIGGERLKNQVLGRELPAFSVKDSDGERSISQFMQAREKLCRSFGQHVLDGAESLANSLGVSSVRKLIEKGEAAKTVIDVANREKADKIIVGDCSAKSWLSRLFNGCTAKDIAAKAPGASVVVA